MWRRAIGTDERRDKAYRLEEVEGVSIALEAQEDHASVVVVPQEVGRHQGRGARVHFIDRPGCGGEEAAARGQGCGRRSPRRRMRRSDHLLDLLLVDESGCGLVVSAEEGDLRCKRASRGTPSLYPYRQRLHVQGLGIGTTPHLQEVGVQGGEAGGAGREAQGAVPEGLEAVLRPVGGSHGAGALVSNQDDCDEDPVRVRTRTGGWARALKVMIGKGGRRAAYTSWLPSGPVPGRTLRGAHSQGGRRSP